MEQFMTSEEIAALLHVDPVTIRRLVTKGELSAYRIGADYRFAPSDLQNYLQRQRIAASAQKDPTPGLGNPLDQFAQVLRKIIQGKYTSPSELVGRFDRFTKRTRHVLLLAQEEAQRFQHNYIGTEHLLLGLIREGEGVASQVLKNLVVDVDQIRQTVETIIGRGERAVSGDVGLTPRSKKVIEFAVYEARNLSHQFVGTEHILLGLLSEGEGIAAEVLAGAGLQLKQVRAETLRVLREKPQEQPEASAPPEASTLLTDDEPGLLCSACGARCPHYFNYCFNCGQSLTPTAESEHGEGQ